MGEDLLDMWDTERSRYWNDYLNEVSKLFLKYQLRYLSNNKTQNTGSEVGSNASGNNNNNNNNNKAPQKRVNPIFEFRQKIILRKIKERTTM
jgi:hypothetical protein